MEFDVLDDDCISNKMAATWYAGYHSGEAHGESEYQHGYAFKVTADGRVNIPQNAPLLKDQQTFTEILAEKTGRDVSDIVIADGSVMGTEE